MSQSQVSGRKARKTHVPVVPPGKLCDPCIYGNVQVVAFRYCINCKEKLCKTCLDVHRKLTISRSHKTVGVDQMNTKVIKTSSLSFENLVLVVLTVTVTVTVLWALWKILLVF
jgi:hypothetical protein